MGWIGKAAIALAVICLAALASADDGAATPIGKQVANFSLPDFRGKAYSLDDYKDKVVVLAFLGTECPLARIYAPRLRDLATEFETQGVVFLGVDANLQDSLAEIGAFARIHRITFPMLKDNNNELADRVGAVRTPEVFLLDRQRVIRYWGRIDNQYGIKTGAGYARPKLTERNLANAVGEVLADKQVSQPAFKADGCFIGRVAKIMPHGEVTYSQQVARIFQNRCVGCHRSGEVAPFAMTSYEEVIGWAAAIREVVQEGRMPPWFADPKYGHFANDARLSDEEKQQIDTWVENGCPQGDVKELPEPRQFAEGWQMGEPDQIVYMREKPFTVSADGVPQIEYFTVDPGWITDQWIQATETRPGNRAVVHHLRVYIVPKSVSDPFPRDGIGWYGPGFPPYVCPPGTAIHVPANARLEFQLHYTPNGTEQDDRSMIGIRFADPKTVKKIMSGPAVTRRDFKIPAGDPNYEVKETRTFFKDTLLFSLLPHMHLRGKSFMFEATYPNGTTEVLLNVPNFDFNWQLRYVFAEPKLIPKGTRLHLTAHFDNSADNLANPDPTRDVTDGQQTWDEMMEGLYTSVDAGQDVACMALVALSLAAQPKAARGPEVIGELKKLLDLGEQSTPEIVATAKAQYRRLKSSYPQDRRIDYAFGLVLVNQHQCREAIPMLSRYLEGSDGEPSAYCAKIWTQMSLQSFADVLADAKALADRFPRNGRSTVEEKYREAARFLGVAFAYLDVARPDVPDGKLRAEELKRISQRLGQTYAPDFEEGKTVVAQRVVELKSQDRLTNGDGRASKMDRLGAAAKDRAPRAVDKLNSQPNTADGKETSLSTYAPFPYQQEKQRVLNWFDP
jgi:peroxiredoxin